MSPWMMTGVPAETPALLLETVMAEKKDQPQQTQPKPGAAPSPPPQPPQPPQPGQQPQHAPGQQPQPGQAQPQGGQAQQPPPDQGGEGPMSQVDWGRLQHSVATVTEHLPEFPDLVTKLADTFKSRPQPSRAAESDAGVDHAGAVDAQTDHIISLLALHLHHKALVRAEAEAEKEE
jgi:outer membrane biosynthesis protein TonB